MIDTDPLGPDETEVTVEVKRDYEDDLEKEPEGSFYVQKETGFIYEVRFFPDFALVRPAHPDYSTALERMDLLRFSELFDEFFGDPQVVKDFMWGANLDTIEVERKK
jgi:hypothetical protein